MQEVITFISNHLMLSAAFVIILILLIGNELLGRATGGKKCSVAQLTQLLNAKEGRVVDIRSKNDYKEGHIVGAMNIPQAELADKLNKLQAHKDSPLIVVDANGTHAHTASTVLKKQGFNDVYYLAGGLATWRQEHFPLVKK